jgi:hypothetical protein
VLAALRCVLCMHTCCSMSTLKASSPVPVTQQTVFAKHNRWALQAHCKTRRVGSLLESHMCRDNAAAKRKQHTPKGRATAVRTAIDSSL